MAQTKHDLLLQGRFTSEALERRQAEAIFKEHLASLQKRIIDGYIALLEEVSAETGCYGCAFVHLSCSSPVELQLHNDLPLCNESVGRMCKAFAKHTLYC